MIFYICTHQEFRLLFLCLTLVGFSVESLLPHNSVTIVWWQTLMAKIVVVIATYSGIVGL